MASCYETLGINSNATPDEIAQAYRFLAQKFHPDANPGNEELARRRFQTIQEAYEILSDPKRRTEYDGKLGAGMGTEWEPITMNTDNGGVRFNSDGSLNIAGRRIGAEEAVPRTSLSAAAAIEKDAGPGGEFRVLQNGKVHRFRFANNIWYAKREKPSGPKKERPTAKPSGSLGSPVPPAFQAPPEPKESTPIRPARRPLRTMLIIGALLTLGIAGGFYASHSHSRFLALTPEEEAKQKEDELKDRQRLFEANQKLQEQATAEEKQHRDIALAKDQLLEAKRIGEGALSSVDTLVTELDEWDRTIPPLLSNDDGRKLATSESNLRVFKSLTSKRRVTKADAAAMRTEIESLLSPVTQSLTSSVVGQGVGEDLSKRIQAKRDSVEQLTTDVHSARESIHNLVLLAAAVPPSSKTLEQALSDEALRDTQKEATLFANTDKTERDNALAAMNDKRRDFMKKEAEKEQLAQEHETNAVRDSIQHEKDLDEAKSTAVQSAIVFFTTPGYYQPDGSATFVKTVQPHPISYSKLLAQGALETTNDGLAQLLVMVTQYPNDLRPKWRMSTLLNMLTPQQTKQLTDTQDYLRRLGPSLVELKMLDP